MGHPIVAIDGSQKHCAIESERKKDCVPKEEVVKAADIAIGAAIAVSYALVHVTCTA